MVVNLECIKAIVIAEANEGLPAEIPFEFQVLEIALEVVCTYLESSVADIERDAYPVLNERLQLSLIDQPGLVATVEHDLVTGALGHWLIGCFWKWEYDPVHLKHDKHPFQGLPHSSPDMYTLPPMQFSKPKIQMEAQVANPHQRQEHSANVLISFMDPNPSSALSSVSQNFVSSNVVDESCVPSDSSLNAFTEEIVAYEKESDETHAVEMIDNYRKCVTVVAGLLKNETTKYYIWLLKAFMKDFGKAPSKVVTDQDGAIRNAIEADFGGSKHRLCMWHITQKLPGKICAKIYDDTDFKKKLNKIIWNMYIGPEDFEYRWKKLMGEFNLVNHKWLTKMFNIRST
uniref:MULE transposase domain-containing protein n=1 Tax=Tanacetum cinerariifolium TaxID=118510 RepID=A0A699GWG6_TANCI|nr:hypothetical protein [Tanacetum cinerariifolium]